MMKLALFVVITVAACGGTPQKPTTEMTTKAGQSAVVELAELQFFEGDDLGMKLHSDGHLEVKMTHSEANKPATEMWHDVGSLGADGTLTHDGKAHGALKADGTVVTTDGKVLGFKLDGDTLVVDDKHITLDDHGVLKGGNPMPKPMRVEGASTKGLRRTALVVLALWMTGMHAESSAPKPAP
jgi:hypothetical protein